jgi:ABC-2 type transport system permease protein
MIGASLYIILCTARNRLRVRLRRLREPRYLIGAIVGVAYIYFSFFARLRTRSSASRAGRNAPPAFDGLLASAPAFGGLILMALAAGAWLLPLDSGLLEFSEAEVQFLFPAPVSRRQLLIHRILRSQIGMLFGAVMIGVFSGASLSGWSRLRIAVAIWVLMVTGKVYFTGVTLARARLAAASARIRRVAWLPVVVTVAVLASVGSAIVADINRSTPDGLGDIIQLVGRISETGISHYLLWPFIVLARPIFAAWPQPFLTSLALAAVIMVAMTTWVLLSDEAFQEAVADAAERRSQQPVKKKGEASYTVRSAGWGLAPVGRPEMAFAWKGAMQSLRMVDKSALIRVTFIMIALTIVAASMGQGNGLASLIGAFSLAGTVFAILLAPQVVRIDLSDDLRHLDLLKTWPVKAAAVVRGELLWPGIVITVGAWAMLAIATVLSGRMLTDVSAGWRFGGGAALAIVAPALVFAQLTIHNAVALLFPAWVPLGNQRPRGLDAMGQRLIMLGGTWLTLVFAALPGAIAGGIVWFAFRNFIGHAALVPAAAVCALILGVEVLAATEAMGPTYEKIDVLAVERAE